MATKKSDAEQRLQKVEEYAANLHAIFGGGNGYTGEIHWCNGHAYMPMDTIGFALHQNRLLVDAINTILAICGSSYEAIQPIPGA